MGQLKFVYQDRSPYRTLFRLWDPNDTIPVLKNMLEPIGKAIGEEMKSVENIHQDDDPDWAMSFVDEKYELVRTKKSERKTRCQ